MYSTFSLVVKVQLRLEDLMVVPMEDQPMQVAAVVQLMSVSMEQQNLTV